MLPSEELLQSIDIIAQNAAKNGVKIYTAIVTSIADNNTCSVRVNGKTHSNIAYYGDAPTVNKSYRVFCPNGSMNQAFIITGGGSSGGSAYTLPIASADVLGGIKVGAGLTISTEGTLSATGGGTADAVEWNNVLDKPTTIAGYGITDAKIDGNNVVLGNKTITPYTPSNPPTYPVDSVNGKTGVVVLSAADVGALPNTTVIPDKTSQLDNDSGYITDSALTGYAKKTEIPTKTSELTNDSGYITNTALEPYAKTVDIPTKTSQLNNDSGYITANDVPVKSVDGATGDVVTNAVKTTAQTLTDAQKQQARTNIGAGTSSFDGNYNSLTNKPTIPTKTSQLTNDSGFITNAALTGYAKTTDIPTKTSQLENDSHYITANEAPVQSVNTKTGAVVLTQDDVGDGATYVRTHNDFTDALKTQINTNEDNIAMLDGDVEGLQTDVGTLKTNVSSLQTALTSKQDVIVGAASTITDNNLVTDRALISDSSGKVAVSNVTSTELGYLDGVTSNVQTQLNNKLEEIPVASSTTLGGVKPVAKTSDMTQSVGVDANGALYTAPGGGGTGSGDMLKSVYDPQNKSTDIFKYANDVADARQAKILVDGILEGDGAGNISAAETVQAELLDVEVLPTVTTADNGKILKVTNGAWVAQQPTTEAWIFTLEDGSTITKNVCIE